MALTSQEEALIRQLLDQQAAILSLAGNEATITSKLGATKVTLADLVAASSLAAADLLLTRQGTTDKSVRADILARYIEAELGALFARLASPAFTGTPTAPTATAGTNTTQLATTQFVSKAVSDITVANASETVAGKIEIATSAEAIAGTDTTRAITPARLRSALNAPGSAPVFACRAWVNFNGTGTVSIRASGNVSSITDNGTGDYTVNFATAMPDVGYSVSGTANPDNGAHGNYILNIKTSNGLEANQTTSSVRVVVTNGGAAILTDAVTVNVAIFR